MKHVNIHGGGNHTVHSACSQQLHKLATDFRDHNRLTHQQIDI